MSFPASSRIGPCSMWVSNMQRYLSGERRYFLSPLKPDASSAIPKVFVESRIDFEFIMSSYLNFEPMSSGR